MEFIKKLLGMSSKKAIKIQDRNNPYKRYGIVVSNLKELKEKGCSKLGLEASSTCSVVLEEDGTEITDEEYYQTLLPHTVVLFLQDGEFWNGSIDYLKRAFEKIINDTDQRQNIINGVGSLIKKNDSMLFANLMNSLAHSLHQNISAEEKSKDPDWFTGLQFRCTNKVEAMKRYSKQRVRGYFSKAKELENTMKSKIHRQRLSEIILKFRDLLESDGYFAVYFDRSLHHNNACFCDFEGWFICEGSHDNVTCPMNHSINPYGSKEARILFSTWNLDHQVEKSRAILPSLKNAIEKCPSNKKINIDYFYSLLFTRSNLKLVEIRCHKKIKHQDFNVDHEKIYVDAKPRDKHK